MKKILIAAATILTLTNCTKNETEGMNFTGKQEIQFVNLNDKVTTPRNGYMPRIANAEGSDYVVYAKWTGGTTNWLFDDVITGSGTNANNPQTGPHYWPTTGTVDFYSWAPATVTATAAYPTITIPYSVPGDANEDFTIAAPKVNMTSTSGIVGLEFSHMLAKISISADLTQELKDGGYTIAFTNGTADLSVNSTGGSIDPTVASPVWSSQNATSATYSDTTSYMIMPQTSTGCTVQITDGIVISKNGTEVFSGSLKEYTIAAGDVTGNQFEKGSHYLLKLIVANTSTGGGGEPVFGDEIKFSASIAADWTTVTSELPQP